MSTDRSKKTWWTVPQVATWIRFRDVEHLADVGEEEQPFEKTARDAIFAALKNGDLIAYANGHSIEAQFWGKGTVFVHRGRKAATLYRSYDAITLDMHDCMSNWRRPAEVLTGEPIPLRELLDQLGELRRQDIAGPIARWFVTLPGVSVTGLDALGDRKAIDALALKDGSIGRHDDSIVAGHGRLRWTNVTVVSVSVPRKGNRAYGDNALVEEVRQAVKSGAAKSYRQAANAIVGKISGGGTAESKAKRIAAKASKDTG